MSDIPVVRSMGETVQVIMNKADYQKVLHSLEVAAAFWDEQSNTATDRAIGYHRLDDEMAGKCALQAGACMALSDMFCDLFERLTGSRSPLYTLTTTE